MNLLRPVVEDLALGDGRLAELESRISQVFIRDNCFI